MNYIVYYIGVVILSLLFGLIADLINIHSFKKQLEQYNLLYPSFKIIIPNKLKNLIELKRNFEDFTFNMSMLHFTTPITNMPNIYGETQERKNEGKDETHYTDTTKR